jgi:HAD superfamily hydrolase (TIGR01459 family)
MTDRDRLPPPARLADLAARYDAFLVDQFGVLTDGVRLYPGACDALLALRAAGKLVALLSNSGRRAHLNAERLAAMGIPGDAYDLFMTSGEFAHLLLRQGGLAKGARHCLLFARGGDVSSIEGTGLAATDDAAAADLVVIAGSDADTRPLASYGAALAPAARRGLPALCLNPDRTMLTGRGLAAGAGRIAALYEAMGGRVTWVGKPHRAIYDHVVAALGGPERSRVICLGDSVEHDIAGARAAGCAAVLVRRGIIAEATDAEILAECARVGAWPDAVLDSFAWDRGAVSF